MRSKDEMGFFCNTVEVEHCKSKSHENSQLQRGFYYWINGDTVQIVANASLKHQESHNSENTSLAMFN